ncbi:MAG: hypothetical protein AAF571_08105 [Verrucomicrobiota bacterium]
MRYTLFAVAAAFVVAFGVLISCRHAKASPQKPNIVLLVLDDAGWTDLTSYGSKIDTPLSIRKCYSGFARCS